MPTLNATIGSASANSFVTLTEAADYFASRPDSDCWTTAGPDTQSRALIFAAKKLNTMSWLGSRVDDTQAMAWPRYEVWKPDGFSYLPSTTIPQQVKDAQCELAYEVVRATTLTAAAGSNGGIQSFSQGDVSITYDGTRNANGAVTTTEVLVDTVLYGLISGSGSLMRS